MTNIASGNKLHGLRLGSLVSVWLDGAATLSSDLGAWSSRRIATIPAGFRPKASLCVPLVTDYGVGMAKLNPDGSVEVMGRGSSIGGNVAVAATYEAEQ
jgi:hypothetical protein|nr:MAG TPA: receptor binding protein [Caudoviricetes sp.]